MDCEFSLRGIAQEIGVLQGGLKPRKSEIARLAIWIVQEKVELSLPNRGIAEVQLTKGLGIGPVDCLSIRRDPATYATQDI